MCIFWLTKMFIYKSSVIYRMMLHIYIYNIHDLYVSNIVMYQVYKGYIYNNVERFISSCSMLFPRWRQLVPG